MQSVSNASVRAGKKHVSEGMVEVGSSFDLGAPAKIDGIDSHSYSSWVLFFESKSKENRTEVFEKSGDWKRADSERNFFRSCCDFDSGSLYHGRRSGRSPPRRCRSHSVILVSKKSCSLDDFGKPREAESLFGEESVRATQAKNRESGASGCLVENGWWDFNKRFAKPTANPVFEGLSKILKRATLRRIHDNLSPSTKDNAWSQLFAICECCSSLNLKAEHVCRSCCESFANPRDLQSNQTESVGIPVDSKSAIRASLMEALESQLHQLLSLDSCKVGMKVKKPQKDSWHCWYCNTWNHRGRHVCFKLSCREPKKVREYPPRAEIVTQFQQNDGSVLEIQNAVFGSDFHKSRTACGTKQMEKQRFSVCFTDCVKSGASTEDVVRHGERAPGEVVIGSEAKLAHEGGQKPRRAVDVLRAAGLLK